MKQALKDAGGLQHSAVGAATTWPQWSAALDAAAEAALNTAREAQAEKLRGVSEAHRCVAEAKG